MTGAEIAVLGWLAEFAKDVLAGLVGDRLKKKPSAERARERAFALYEALARLRETSARFVDALRETPQSRDPDPLQDAMADVSRALENVARAAHEIDTQLEVYVPEVAQDVIDARRSRAFVLARTDESLERLATGREAADWPVLIAAAEQAQLEIEEATEGIRSFLAQEFTFKESF